MSFEDDNNHTNNEVVAKKSEATNSNNFLKFLYLFIVIGVILFAADVFELGSVSNDGNTDTGLIAGASHVELKKTVVKSNGVDEKQAIKQPSENPDESKSSAEVIKSDESKPVPSGTEGTPATASSGSTEASNDKRHTYRRRGQPLSDEERKAMIDKWGSWTFQDTKERPQTDYYKKYPNRDVPRAEFPANAWQIDKEYLGKFLPEALALVKRAQNAIIEEYGNNTKMFEVEHIENFTAAEDLESGRRGVLKRESLGLGGWTTPKSWEGVQRRLLHAIMTEDSFNFAMAGHSAAAGHGNHFQQSYTLQVQWILEAVFSRLGVRHSSRNFGNGGLGVIQHAIASAGVFGPDVDMLMWDSGMTEGHFPFMDVMIRQQILGGTKVPIIWSLTGYVSKFFHLHADVDVGYPGDGRRAIPVGDSVQNITKMAWALQYVSCTTEMKQICRNNEYIGVCWIDRDDFTPPVNQDRAPGGRASWHPGNRIHQVRGRILAYTILEGLKGALTTWNEAPNYELPDEAWHLTAINENIRSKVAGFKEEDGWCHDDLANKNLDFICNVGMKARTEFTPRSYADQTNMRTLMPPSQLEHINDSEWPIYMPPDVFNPALHPPKGAIDVLNIVEAGVDFKSTLNPDYTSDFYEKPTFASPPKMTPGKGFYLDTHAGDGFCDGTVDSFCNRGWNNNCLLYAHNDGRNGIKMDGHSGWMVMNLPNLIRGYIAIKLESWHQPGSVPATKGWTSENNETASSRYLRRSFSPPSSSASSPTPSHHNTTMPSWPTSDVQSHRELGKKPPPAYCADFKFEYAIDGKITSLNLTEWEQQRKQVARVVETVTLLRDPDYTGGVAKEVEVAFRMTGCAQSKVFRVSHIYFA